MGAPESINRAFVETLADQDHLKKRLEYLKRLSLMKPVGQCRGCNTWIFEHDERLYALDYRDECPEQCWKLYRQAEVSD